MAGYSNPFKRLAGERLGKGRAGVSAEKLGITEADLREALKELSTLPNAKAAGAMTASKLAAERLSSSSSSLTEIMAASPFRYGTWYGTWTDTTAMMGTPPAQATGRIVVMGPNGFFVHTPSFASWSWDVGLLLGRDGDNLFIAVGDPGVTGPREPAKLLVHADDMENSIAFELSEFWSLPLAECAMLASYLVQATSKEILHGRAAVAWTPGESELYGDFDPKAGF